MSLCWGKGIKVKHDFIWTDTYLKAETWFLIWITSLSRQTVITTTRWISWISQHNLKLAKRVINLSKCVSYHVKINGSFIKLSGYYLEQCSVTFSFLTIWDLICMLFDKEWWVIPWTSSIFGQISNLVEMKILIEKFTSESMSYISFLWGSDTAWCTC